MGENSNQPREFDAVLGRQIPPPVAGVVLGGIEGLRRRFQSSNTEQRLAAVDDALKYGDAGVDLLITAMNDEALIIRGTAYNLLERLSSEKAQQAIADGIILNKGDRVYRVYESRFSYYDIIYPIYYEDYDYYYDCELNYSDYEYFEEYYKQPKFVSCHFSKDSAESEAELLHQLKIMQTDASYLSRYPIKNFNINEWCAANSVYPIYEPNEGDGWVASDESDWEFEYRVLKTLQKYKHSELLAQLWQLMGFGRLAFVHEQIIKEKTYLI